MMSTTRPDVSASANVSDDVRRMEAMLAAAWIDWPTRDLGDAVGLVVALRSEIGRPLTYARLHEYASRLDPATDAWKAEAMASLLAFFRTSTAQGLGQGAELDEAVAQLNKKAPLKQG